MLKKVIEYETFDGDKIKETSYFHLSKVELLDLNFSVEGGLNNYIEKISREKDNKKILEIVKDLVLKSYGRKSEDGRRFIKDEEATKAFLESPAMDELFIELLDASKMVEFINGLLPKGLLEDTNKAIEEIKNKKDSELTEEERMIKEKIILLEESSGK